MKRLLLLTTLVALLSGCQSAYYAAAEQVGYHKREIMVDRVVDARDAQADVEEQFQSAQEQLLTLINFDGGELQEVYEDLSDEYEASREAADEVTSRIDAIEDVADALFDEWSAELDEYSNARLRRDSESKLKETQRRYAGLIQVMRRSETRMEPVLAALKDNVLYLKHNLNAQAVASLKVEFGQLDKDIDVLIAEVRKAIASSDEFIESLNST